MNPCIVLSAAHHLGIGAKDADYQPGATFRHGGKQYTEAEWSYAVVHRIEAGLRFHGYATMLLAQPLGATIRALGAMPKGSVLLALEPHLNADPDADGIGDPEADYGQVIRDERNTSAPIMGFAERFVERLGLARRAARLSPSVRHDTSPLPWFKPPRHLGFIEKHPHPAIITESGFIDNRAFVAWAFSDDGLTAIADAHVSSILRGWPK